MKLQRLLLQGIRRSPEVSKSIPVSSFVACGGTPLAENPLAMVKLAFSRAIRFGGVRPEGRKSLWKKSPVSGSDPASRVPGGRSAGQQPEGEAGRTRPAPALARKRAAASAPTTGHRKAIASAFFLRKGLGNRRTLPPRVEDAGSAADRLARPRRIGGDSSAKMAAATGGGAGRGGHLTLGVVGHVDTGQLVGFIKAKAVKKQPLWKSWLGRPPSDRVFSRPTPLGAMRRGPSRTSRPQQGAADGTRLTSEGLQGDGKTPVRPASGNTPDAEPTDDGAAALSPALR